MPIDLNQLLEINILTRALYVAADINIAEHISQAALSIEDLANATGTHPASLARLMYFLELYSIFDQREGKYYLTTFSQTMHADHPNSIKAFLLHDDETRWNSFGNLGYSIRTGNASFDMLYNENYFEYLKKHPLLQARFDEAMTIISKKEDEQIAAQINFKGIVADIGGGKGQLLANIAQKHILSQAILFDLPEVVEQLTDNSSSLVKIAGSFFEEIPVTADIFILKRIVHDWSDEKVVEILRNVANAMHPNSTLYIIDGLLDCAQNKKFLAAVDLALLTIFQGQERTLSQMTHLLTLSGLQIVTVHQINELLFAIECKQK